MLHSLVEYGRQQSISGETGFTTKTIRWLINFDTNGKYLGIMQLGDSQSRKNKGQDFTKVPHLKFSGDTPMRQFLVDTAQYVLLYEQDETDEKLLRKHNYFLDLLRESSQSEPILQKIANAINDKNIRGKICEDLKQQSPKAKASDNVTFAELSGSQASIIVKKVNWHNWWREYFPTLFKQKESLGQMLCFISGQLTEPMQTHPKIKQLGDVGGTIETTLIGFNKDSFCSYGLVQSNNAAVSVEMAEQYAAVLNHLLVNNSRRLAGSKIVYWYTGDVRPEDDVMQPLFEGDIFGDVQVEDKETEKDEESSKRKRLQAENRVADLLDAIRSGKRPDLKNSRFCAMTLSGNSGRVVVRDWMEGQFEDLVNNINEWFKDTSIISRDGNSEIKSHKLSSILAAPVRVLKEITTPLETTIWHAAVRHEPLSYQIMAQTLSYVKNDFIQNEPARPARLGILKAYCNRNERMPKMKEKLDIYLKDSAYLCGRIMAILADIQYKAMGDVGAGIIQRYYAAASATPALTIGRLIRLAKTGHLPKIEPVKLRNWYDNQLANVWNELQESPPVSLNLEKQTLFAMGYYQQKAYRKENELNVSTQNKENNK